MSETQNSASAAAASEAGAKHETNTVECLRQCRLQLEAANKELEAFAYSVSHDLRAPLRAIDGFSRILMQDHASQLDATGRRYLDIVSQSAKQMGQLIDDLLAFSRLNRKSLDAREIDLGGIARAVAAELVEADDTIKVEFIWGSLPPVKADETMMRQVLTCLLSNAVKFTRPRPAARVEIGCVGEPGAPHYYVRDNGVGFDMQYAQKLFGVFQRLHRAEDFEGNGVGLAMVQRIIHRHGGKVWAEARVNEGATFYFTLQNSFPESR